RITRNDGCVTVVEDPQDGERVELGLEMPARRAAGRTDRPGSKTGARAVGDKVVDRGSDDRHIRAPEISGVLCVGDAGEAQETRVVWLFAVFAPPFEGVDHAAIVLSARRPTDGAGGGSRAPRRIDRR